MYQSLTYPEQKTKILSNQRVLGANQPCFLQFDEKFVRKIKKDNQTGFVVKYVINSVTECMQAERSAVSLQAATLHALRSTYSFCV